MTQTTSLTPATVQTVAAIPGLTAFTTQTFIQTLSALPQQPLKFWLNGAPLIGPGYHVTEVKAVTIEAVDCGGGAASWRETVIQLMDGSEKNAAGGYMSTRKFLAIYTRVTGQIPVRAEAEVRFEYGGALLPAMQYHIAGMEIQPDGVVVHLRTPGVQCKAGETCGLPAGETTQAAEGCSPDSGCCAPSPAVPAELMTLG